MACEIEASVRAYDPSGREFGYADTMRATLFGRDMTRPEMVFALEAEAALTAAMNDLDCQGTETIKLDLSFIEMDLTASAEHLARFDKIMKARTGPYATVRFDQNRSVVTAIIEWNPRQILRDQLTLLGWEIDHDAPLPFDEALYQDLADKFTKQVAAAPTPASSRSAWENLRSEIPTDLFALFSQKPLSLRGVRVAERMNLGMAHFGLKLMNHALEISQPGYSGMTGIVIQQALDDPSAEPIRSVGEAITAGHPQPYEKLNWMNPADIIKLYWE